MKMLQIAGLGAAFGFALAAQPVFAENGAPIPACALSGSKSVFIGGAPALRLSDVVNCPPELYEIVPSIMIEGQPMVKFRSGAGEKGNCTARGEETVMAEGEQTSRLGDVACTQN